MKLDLTQSSYLMKMSEKDYHDAPAWSYSLIAKYARNGFKALETLHDKMEVTPEMKFGSLFDSLMTRGLEETRKNYCVFNGEMPTESIKNVLDAILEESGGTPWTDVDNSIKAEVLNRLEFQKNWGFDAKIRKVENFLDYYDFIYKAYGKNIISNEECNDAIEMRKNMFKNKYIASLFGKPGYHKDTDIEYIYQPQFCIPFNTGKNAVYIKCMFDLIVVNHKEKTITPVDLKTSFMPAYDFAKHWLQMRYDIQGDLYTYVLDFVVNELTDIEDDSEYKIMPYIFVDISRTDKIPVAFEFDPKMNVHLQFKNYSYKNWKELLDEIIYYEQNKPNVPSYISETSANDIMKLLNHE